MCFHNSMSAKAQKLAARYGKKTDIIEAWKEIMMENYHVNAFTNPIYPIITEDKEIQAFNWGLIPSWTKTKEDAEEIRKMTYNAKAETIFEKPSYRHPIKSKRCIVPSTGFFEWRHEGDKKIPYFIRVKDEEIFSMAGIYDIWQNPEDNSELHTFSIVTTHANKLMDYIHNTKHRMPVILPEELESRWLKSDLTKEEIEAILLPFNSEQMEAYTISKDFLHKNPHDKNIIDKVI